MISLIVKVLYFFDAILNYEFSTWQYIGLGVIGMLSIIGLEIYCKREEKKLSWSANVMIVMVVLTSLVRSFSMR